MDETGKTFLDTLPGKVEIKERDQRTPAQRVVEEAQKILGPGIRVVLAVDRPDQKPGRIAVLHQEGFRAVRWSELTAKQHRAFDDIIPYHRDDHVRFVDCILMAAKEAVYQARVRRKRAASLELMRAKADAESPKALERDLGMAGVEVTDKL